MSKVLIETYRGWEIHFDTEKETFTCFSNDYDNENTKKSFAATKKYIDDYIKENETFVPFVVENQDDAFYGGGKKKKIIGIRKDGVFVYIEKEGDKPRQFSSYDESNYYVVDHANEPINEQIKQLRNEQDIINKKIKSLNSQMIKKTVKEVRLERYPK
jgi:hypothetical protein